MLEHVQKSASRVERKSVASSYPVYGGTKIHFSDYNQFALDNANTPLAPKGRNDERQAAVAATTTLAFPREIFEHIFTSILRARLCRMQIAAAVSRDVWPRMGGAQYPLMVRAIQLVRYDVILAGIIYCCTNGTNGIRASYRVPRSLISLRFSQRRRRGVPPQRNFESESIRIHVRAVRAVRAVQLRFSLRFIAARRNRETKEKRDSSRTCPWKRAGFLAGFLAFLR